MQDRQAVTYAKLHTNIYLPNIAGELGSTLPPSNKTVDAKMFLAKDGLEVSIFYRNANTTFLVPYANIQVMVLASTPVKKAEE